jgi:hypothetical protein
MRARKWHAVLHYVTSYFRNAPRVSESEERLLARHNNIKTYLKHWIYRTMTGCHEHDREPSDSMKYLKVFSFPKRVKFLGGFGCFVCWILKATATTPPPHTHTHKHTNRICNT